MKICVLEPFFGGSHKKWIEQWAQHSRHDVHWLTLPGRHWKWRMYGGAVSLARQYRKLPKQPDLLVVSDMLDLATFLGLIGPRNRPPVAVYFHENQLVYPWSETDPDTRTGRANQYAFINFTSALAADALAFNSRYHQRSFLEALPPFLRQFPDHQEEGLVPGLIEKSEVLSLGLNLSFMPDLQNQETQRPPLIVWNHRWEYDKQPEVFFDWMYKLKQEGLDFRLVLLGEAFGRRPAVFKEAHTKLADQILFSGFTNDRSTYLHWLSRADILPVTSIQGFFGGSVVEALYAGCLPVLPNRLAYPEHLPLHLHETFLYNTSEEGYRLLRRMVRDPEAYRVDISSIRKWVKRYDWHRMAPLYDDWATGLMKEHLA
jgi:glycosyltransferase involved in cell wall biosynthesis